MGLDHGVLDRMKLIRRRLEAFDGDDVFAIELIEELNAGIHRFVAQAILVEPPNEDRACSAIAFRTNDLGANEVQLLAKEIGQRGKYMLSTNFEAFAVYMEYQIIAHRADTDSVCNILKNV